MHVTALIATYQRPAFLEAGVRALWAQTRPPDSIVVVTRDTDEDSSAMVARLARGPIPLVHGTVSEPGHLPPLIEGRRLLPAAADVVVQLDDDLIPHRGVIARVQAHFEDGTIGLVAGRLVEHDEGRRRPAPATRGGGEVSFSGRIRAAHSNAPRSLAPHPTQWATGALAAYRRSAFDRIVVRPRLNLNVAIGYEIDWGLQIGAMGYRAVFDPQVAGDHHNAPRGHGTQRADAGARAIFARNHNHTYVLLHHLHGVRRVAYLVRHFAIGDRWGEWGVGSAAYATLRERSLRWRDALPHAYRGRLAAIRAYVDERLAS
jgi:GT2 family glycosyltransferase